MTESPRICAYDFTELPIPPRPRRFLSFARVRAITATYYSCYGVLLCYESPAVVTARFGREDTFLRLNSSRRGRDREREREGESQ